MTLVAVPKNELPFDNTFDIFGKFYIVYVLWLVPSGAFIPLGSS